MGSPSNVNSLQFLLQESQLFEGSCHTYPMADNEDIKQRMKAALEAKNRKAQKSTPHGSAPKEGAVHEHSDREGGKREFRRKSGG